jgi:hypothetical protein
MPKTDEGPFVPNPLAKWAAPDDVPYNERVDYLHEWIQELGFFRAPPFRAAMLHKLAVCYRAFGQAETRSRLQSGSNLSKYIRNGLAGPTLLVSLDDLYYLALEKLIQKYRKIRENRKRSYQKWKEAKNRENDNKILHPGDPQRGAPSGEQTGSLADAPAEEGDMHEMWEETPVQRGGL